MAALPTTWYYEHIDVVPIWGDDDILIYRAKLPLVDNAEYLRYIINTWPVPVNESGYVMKLIAQQDVAIHTGNGDVFLPSKCQGKRPAVCRTGPIYSSSRMRCERGILNENDEDRSNCRIQVSRRPLETTVEELEAGHYVVQSSGGAYTLHCVGKRQIKDVLPLGVFIVQIPNDCELRGSDWTIRGEIRRFSQVTLRVKRLRVKPISLIPDSNLVDNLPAIEKEPWTILKDLDTFDIATVSTDPMNWTHAVRHSSWINALLIIAIIIALIVGLKYSIVHRRKVSRLFKKHVIKFNDQIDKQSVVKFGKENHDVSIYPCLTKLQTRPVSTMCDKQMIYIVARSITRQCRV